MAAKTYLKTNEFLATNEYLVSPNGVFFVIMQGDGNLVVYRGAGPNDHHGALWASDKVAPAGDFYAIMQADGNLVVYKGTGPNDNRGALWASGTVLPTGDFFANMQDDGNFVVYKGTGPADSHGPVWASNKMDPVVDIESISNLEYDVAAAKILKTSSADLYHETVTNKTKQTQTSSIAGSKSYSETHGWSDSLAIKAGVKTNIKTGIPVIAEGKVEVSVEATNTYTWNGSETTSTTWSWNTPVTVPPHGSIVAFIAVAVTTLAVPYTLKGVVVLKSGAKVPATISGLYTGSNSHDLSVTFVEQDVATSEIVTETKELVGAAST